ncbi:MAG TPA: hypothetical protein VE866_15900, partial [Candidatus Binatia bacterium]|nr:hypothetical protein [Candidatus Binatia bacterium]
MKHKGVRRAKSNRRRAVSRPSFNYSELTKLQKPEYDRSIELLSDLRDDKDSYTKLLRTHHLTSRKAHRYLDPYLLGATRGGRVQASKTDRLVRELWFPNPIGDVRKLVRGSTAATKIANFRQDRGKLLNNEISAAEFEAKWRGVRVDGREVFADADGIFRM